MILIGNRIKFLAHCTAERDSVWLIYWDTTPGGMYSFSNCSSQAISGMNCCSVSIFLYFKQCMYLDIGSGTTSRFCFHNGTWDKNVNVSQCIGKDFTEIAEQVYTCRPFPE